MSGGAWPFLVGELTCLPDRDNERDLSGLIGCAPVRVESDPQPARSRRGIQLLNRALYDASTTNKVDSRSVMLLDVLGCTRTTMKLAPR